MLLYNLFCIQLKGISSFSIKWITFCQTYAVAQMQRLAAKRAEEEGKNEPPKTDSESVGSDRTESISIQPSDDEELHRKLNRITYQNTCPVF